MDVKKCGLLGRKLTHSYSPMIHKSFALGYSYKLFEVEPEDLSDFLKNGDFHGLNVTIPYKKDVIPFCTELSPIAHDIGSVNTLVRLPDGGIKGDNTDGMGFSAMLSQFEVVGKKIIVLGSGGSSLTVHHVLKHQNAREVILISRDGENNYNNIANHSDAQIIINTTPVGMYPNVGEIPVNLDVFSRVEGVLDLIYNPAKTQLFMDAEERGIKTLGGLTMLVGQAAAASELFATAYEPINILSTIQHIRQKTENIILIGMPGCGKTTIGRILAEKLGKTFVDADEEIEKVAGRTIPEIFATHGEEFFRQQESAVLQKFGKESNQVISTGGGCVTRAENFYHLRQNGIVVFLERDLQKLDREGRPLSQGNLQNMYEIRQPLYKRFAHITIQNNDDPQKIAQAIACSAGGIS